MSHRMLKPALTVFKSAVQHLRDAGVDEAELDAKYIVCHVLGVPVHALYTEKALVVDRKQHVRILKFLNQRIKGRPLQYIIGNQSFYGLLFNVNPNVLIPRPETELLVEKALEKAQALKAPKILDLCTGSGCIAIALKTQLSDAQITATDISLGALKTAKKNARQNHTGIRFLRRNLLKNIDGSFDILVTNPPYINQTDYLALDDKVKKFEPKAALLGGTDGFVIIREIITEALWHLNSGGWLLMEIGHDQREATEALMTETGYTEIRTFRDYSGFDRIVTGRKK